MDAHPKLARRRSRGNGRQTLQTLKAADSAAFDALYIRGQIQQHQEVLDLLDNHLIPRADDPRLKLHLQNSRTLVDSHLNKAKEVQSLIGRDPSLESGHRIEIALRSRSEKDASIMSLVFQRLHEKLVFPGTPGLRRTDSFSRWPPESGPCGLLVGIDVDGVEPLIPSSVRRGLRRASRGAVHVPLLALTPELVFTYANLETSPARDLSRHDRRAGRDRGDHFAWDLRPHRSRPFRPERGGCQIRRARM